MTVLNESVFMAFKTFNPLRRLSETKHTSYLLRLRSGRSEDEAMIVVVVFLCLLHECLSFWRCEDRFIDWGLLKIDELIWMDEMKTFKMEVTFDSRDKP